MLRKIELKNSTILLFGILLIVIGFCFGLYEYFIERKNEVFNEMNILLYENEKPKYIDQSEEFNDNPKENINLEEPIKEETKYNYIGLLEIPKIGLKQGFLDLKSKYNNIKYNVTVINGSTFPNENNNNLILAAHSGVCTICYFNKLFNLSNDDYAYIYYKNIKYLYKLVNIYEVEKDGTVPIYRDYNKNVLTLITCTKNSNTKQTVFIFEEYNKENY